jgi:hypothetical protein
MGEKKGQTEKLKYDFPTEKECQVMLNDKWYRATPRDFRSWGSRRQIIYNNPDRTQTFEEYEGPVYYWNTNKICKEPDNNGVQYIHNMPFRSVVRPGEHKFLDR